MALTQDQADRINEMVVEINAAPRIYRPSKFWVVLCQKNVKQLSEHGLENFKRTVNQNYFNWVPTPGHKRQYRYLYQFFEENPPLASSGVYIEDVGLFENMWGGNYFSRDSRRITYAKLVWLLWHYALKTDKRGLLSSMSEPVLGNPVRITLDGKLISQDLAHSVRETNVVMDHVRDAKVVAELGAGYGRLAYVFGMATRCRYLIFDIPPALYIAQWYLGQLFPDRRHFTFRHFDRFEEIVQDLERSDFAFFTPNQLALFPPKYVEAFITISSLQEMLPEQVENYLRLMAHTTQGIIYLKQLAKWRNAWDDVVIRWDDYRISDWELLLNRRDDVEPRLCEMVYRAPGKAKPKPKGE